MFRSVIALAIVAATTIPLAAAEPARRPNIIFILADDLGYGDLGCYGQTMIQTPNLDRMATDGMRFTQCYAGSTVCAPSRCALMTGLHTGHGRIRGNAAVPLEPGDVTVAEVLKKAGYATGLFGKWGLGEPSTTGAPNKKGFDEFFGFTNQTHAHNYYPDFLWRDGAQEKIAGNVLSDKPQVSAQRAQYAPDLFARESLSFIERHKDRPFFLYFATTVPHANNERNRAEGNGNEVPDLGAYADKPWPVAEKSKAAMISRLDADVGRLLAKLKELKLDENTIAFFTSDNGPHKEGGNDPKFFNSSGPLRGIKRDLTDGGIRIPVIVRWPGHVQPGTVNDLVWAFWDFPATATELAGTTMPGRTDGLSVVPTLTGQGSQVTHDFLYWEFHEQGSKQAVRMGDWKALRLKVGGPLEIYNVKSDAGESMNLAAQLPHELARFEAYLKTARTESPRWPLSADAGKQKQKQKAKQ